MLNLDSLQPDDKEPYSDPSFQKRFPNAYDRLIRVGRMDNCVCGKHDSIYRVMRLCHLTEMIEEKEITLTNPHEEWDDPFENPLYKLRVEGSEGDEVSLKEFVKDVYGSCWTTREEADYMWDYYTDEEEKAVIIESTPMRILGSFLENTNIDEDNKRDLGFCIGAVRYIEESDFIRKFSNLEMIGGDYMGWKNLSPITSLLIKRKEFEYEKEVRLLYRVKNNSEKGVRFLDKGGEDKVSNRRGMVKVTINPEKVIKSIKFNPWIDNYKELESRIRDLGFSGNIGFSTLFEEPDLPEKINSEYPISYIKRRI